tara:strand:+ start:364 stop:972 length:609 start_codon:yes stop_codon:yes gene_type:complete
MNTQKLLKQKMPFMRNVFMNLIFQSVVVYLSAKASLENASLSDFISTYPYAIPLLLFASTIAFIYSKTLKLNIQMKFALLTFMSSLLGASLSPSANIQEALQEVIAIFVAMFFLGVASVYMGFDLRPLGLLLVFGLFGLIIARIATNGKNSYSNIATLLFALFIVFDTNNILQKDYGGNFTDATFDYILDIFNLLQTQMNDD